MHRYLIYIALGLAACTTPLQRCEQRAGRDLQALDKLITTTRGNIERGYALENQPQVAVGLQLCTSPSANFHFCTATQSRPKPTPVAIDISAEKRKLKELLKRRRSIQQQTEAEIAACRKSDPA